jgi:transposase
MLARELGISRASLYYVSKQSPKDWVLKEKTVLGITDDSFAQPYFLLSATVASEAGKCWPRHRAIEFRKFSKQIDRAVPADLTVHLVLDNYATHKTKEIRAWFLRHPRYHLHFTPTHSSWLNQVERWFALLSQRQIKRGSHYSVHELESAILEFIEVHNEQPKPFLWTKSADAILNSIGRFASRTLAAHGANHM